MEKLLKSTARVRFQDCDPFNHLNNSKYIDYFLNAREDHILEHYNLNLFELAQSEKVGWVVATNQLAYLVPAFPNEIIVLSSQLIAFNEKSITVEMFMWDEKEIRLKAFIWFTFVHISVDKKGSISHASKYADLFKAVLLPIKENIFEERMLTLKSQQKPKKV
jgi:thioesterase III